MHHYTITISKSNHILMNFVDFIQTRLCIKIQNVPNITALSNIRFATILTIIFVKQKSFLFSFVNLDKEKISKKVL